MAVCELLYAGLLCISPVSGGATPVVDDEVKIEATRSTTWSGANVQAKGWSAEVVRGTDNIRSVNPKSLTQLCEGAACVRYHLFCRPNTDFWGECRFSIAVPGRDQPFDISVTADGIERQRAALRSLIYVTPDGLRIPLERMSTRSTRESPYCARIRPGSEAPEYEPDCAFLNR